MMLYMFAISRMLVQFLSSPQDGVGARQLLHELGTARGLARVAVDAQAPPAMVAEAAGK
jgi:hypothetical protein